MVDEVGSNISFIDLIIASEDSKLVSKHNWMINIISRHYVLKKKFVTYQEMW